MLITDDFVLINFPKTGSTFVRSAIKEIYARREHAFRRVAYRTNLLKKPLVEEFVHEQEDRLLGHGGKDQHGTYSQIPEEHRDKTIVTVVRNPFSRYISTYRFGWWKKHPPADRASLRKDFPSFPDLSFEAYMDMANSRNRDDFLNGIQPKYDLGLHSVQFIRYYFRDPDDVLKRLDDAYLDGHAYMEEMPKIVFIHQEQLEEDLCAFLQGVGFDDKSTAFIHDKAEANVTPGIGGELEEFYTPELADKVLVRDKLLFSLFPEYRASIPHRSA